MRVLLINVEGGHVGGAASIASDIAQTVNDNQGDSVVCYGRLHADESGLDLFKVGNDLSVKMHAIITRVFDLHGLGSIKATKRLIRFIDTYHPDLINLHIIHGYFLNYLMLFSYISKTKIPVVWTFHDSWAFTGHCAIFDSIGCNKWRNGCKKCPQKHNYPSSLLIDNARLNYKMKKLMFSNVDNMVIVTPSQWLANLVKKSFLGKNEIVVINNGIDLEVFKPTVTKFKEKYGIVNKKMVLGVAATWGETKGLSAFIELSKRLSDEYQIVLIGLSDEQLAALPTSIIGIKKTVDRNELIEAYTAADVFVDPTTSDNFPTVILESLACGTPVVAYNTGGCPEEVDDTCGEIVEKGDIDGLIRGITKLTATDLSKECIERATRFNKKDKYSEYLNLFKRLIKE